MAGQVTLEHFMGDVDSFRKTSWQRFPSLHRTGQASPLTDLLRIDVAEHYLSSLRPPHLEIKRNGKGVRERTYTHTEHLQNVTLQNFPSPTKLKDEFWRGATLILNHLEDFDAPIAEACQILSEEFTAPVHTVSFISPPLKAGLLPHFDTFEGFIVQTSGTKLWKIYEPAPDLVIRSRGLHGVEGLKLAMEAELRPGDCLYLPWGYPHMAATTDTTSSHITFMVQTAGWFQAAKHRVGNWIPEAAYDVRIPRVPGAQTVEEFVQFAQQTIKTGEAESISISVLDWLRESQTARRSSSRQALRRLLSSETLSSHEPVEWNGPVLDSIMERNANRLSVVYAGVRISIPVALESYLRALSESEGPALIPNTQIGPAEGRAREILRRQLYGIGLLQRVQGTH